MYIKKILRKTLLFFLVMGICLFFHTNNTDASQQWEGIQPKDLVYVEITAPVVEINIGEAYLIVGDKKFYVSDITWDGKRYKPKLIDEEGGDVPLRFFRKGRTVFVAGCTVPDGRNAAFVIKQLSAYEEARVKKGLKYQSSRLMRHLRNSLSDKEKRKLDSSELMRRLRDKLSEKQRLSKAKRRLRDSSAGKQGNQ